MVRSLRYARLLPAVSVAILAGIALAPRMAQAQANLPSPTAMGPGVKGNNDINPAQPSQPGLPGASRPTSISRGTISGDMMSGDALGLALLLAGAAVYAFIERDRADGEKQRADTERDRAEDTDLIVRQVEFGEVRQSLPSR